MKVFQTKTNLFKGAILCGALALGAVSFAKSNQSVTRTSSLRDLSTVSNANAEGTVSCGGAGSGCSFSFNGTTVSSSTLKEPS